MSRTTRLTRRGRVALRVAATFLLVTGVAVGAVALQPDESEAATPVTDESPATALLSPRRVPQVFTEEVARARLQASIDAFIAPYDGCLAVDAPDGTDLAATPDGPRIPASTMKLFTGAAALSALGPDHEFITRVVGNDDQLTVVGSGDPVLTTPEYEAALRESPRTANDVITPMSDLADSIAAAGITQVEQLAVDDSHQDTLRFLPEWPASYQEDIGPLGALTVDDGFDQGVRVSDPALFAGQQLADLLTDRGIEVGAVVRSEQKGDSPEIARVVSPPLADIVASMLTSSDNLTAELLLRELTGEGTTSAGANSEREILTDLGVPMDGVVISDGSGLARENRLTCAALTAVLGLGSAKYPALLAGLPVAGEPGTLALRFASDDPLTGVLHAKTGFLNDVAGLAGYVDDPEALRFAFVLNHDMTTEQGRALQADAARLVAAYPDAPPAAGLVPAP